MKKNNVLFLLHLPPPIHGSSVIGKSIKDSILINTSFDCRYINLLVSRKIEDTGKTSSFKIIRFVIGWLYLLAEILKKKSDLCYMALTTTGTAFYKDVLFIVLLRLFNIKRVYHLHNKGISLYQSQKLNYYLYRFVFNDADVILLSKYLRNDIQKFVTETHIHICPNGIASCAAEINYQHLKSGDPPIRILFLSNLIESKGVFVLLEACSILQKNGIPFQCVFIGGEGNVDASRFNEKVVLMGLSDRIVYRGIKYGEEKISAFAEADIFVFPTYYECFPLVLLEAMSASLPIVSTFEGGIPDIVEDGVTGFLVPQKNAELLADKLELLILNPSLRKEMGCAGRKKYESQFTLEHFEKNLCTILQKLTK